VDGRAGRKLDNCHHHATLHHLPTRTCHTVHDATTPLPHHLCARCCRQRRHFLHALPPPPCLDRTPRLHTYPTYTIPPTHLSPRLAFAPWLTAVCSPSGACLLGRQDILTADIAGAGCSGVVLFRHAYAPRSPAVNHTTGLIAAPPTHALLPPARTTHTTTPVLDAGLVGPYHLHHRCHRHPRTPPSHTTLRATALLTPHTTPTAHTTRTTSTHTRAHGAVPACAPHAGRTTAGSTDVQTLRLPPVPAYTAMPSACRRGDCHMPAGSAAFKTPSYTALPLGTGGRATTPASCCYARATPQYLPYHYAHTHTRQRTWRLPPATTTTATPATCLFLFYATRYTYHLPS